MHPTFAVGPLRTDGVAAPGGAADPPLADGDEALLAEAIRFFNLPHPLVTRAGFEPLRFVAAELTEARALLHDVLFEHLVLATHQAYLAAVVPGTKLQGLMPPAPPSKKGKQAKPASFPWNHTTRAKVAMRSLLDPQWRRFDAKNVGPLAVLAWDGVDAARQQLRAATRRDAMVQKLTDTFGSALASPPGGDAALRLQGASVPSDGLAGKVWTQLGCMLPLMSFPWTIGFPLTPIQGTGTRPFDLHLQTRASAVALLDAALPFGSRYGDDQAPFLPIFANWLEMLDRIEAWIAPAASTAVGAQVGLPWGLIFTSTLRVYLVDVLVSLLSCAMPLARLHDQLASAPHTSAALAFRYFQVPKAWKVNAYRDLYNGNLAVGLWECLSGELLAHPNEGHAGLMAAKASDAPLAVLSRWTPDDVAGAWGTGGVAPEHRDLSVYLRRAASAPYFEWVSETSNTTSQRRDGADGLLWKQARQLSGDAVVAGWPAHPRFFREVRPDKRTRPSEVGNIDSAGTLFAQLSLFAARTIADHLAKRLKIARTILSPGDGSLLWGGAHYTHREHRLGGVFDLTHPFIHTMWPLMSAKGKPPFYRGTVGHVQTQSELASVAPDRVDYPQEALYKVVDEALKRLAAGVDLAAIERDLLWGTPTRTERAEIQTNLIGHVALLLGGISKMIVGSAILHLRALTLLRDAHLDAPLEKLHMLPKTLRRNFFFKPEDHYNHWHVAFYGLAGPAGHDDNAQGEGRPIQIDEVKALVALWSSLGIPLGVFRAYLEGLALATSGPRLPAVAKVASERDRLVQLLSKGVPDEKQQLEALDRGLAPLLPLFAKSELVDWTLDTRFTSKALQAIWKPVDRAAQNVSDPSEHDKSEGEQKELQSIDPSCRPPGF